MDQPQLLTEEALAELGFPADAYIAAVAAGKTSVEEAVEWLLSGGLEEQKREQQGALALTGDGIPQQQQPPRLLLRQPMEIDPPAAPQEKPQPAAAPAEEERVRSRMAQYEGRDKITQQLEDKEKAAALEAARKRRLMEMEDKKRVMKEIEEDKKRRQDLGKTVKKEHEGTAPAGSQPGAPSPGQPGGSAAGTPSSVRNTMIQVRMTNGTVARKSFPVEATLQDVKQFAVEKGEPSPHFHLVQPFPHTSFEGKNMTLLEAGLVPNASLVVNKSATPSAVVPEPQVPPELPAGQQEPEEPAPRDGHEDSSDEDMDLPIDQRVLRPPYLRGRPAPHRWGTGVPLGSGNANPEQPGPSRRPEIGDEEFRERRQAALRRMEQTQDIPINGPQQPEQPVQPEHPQPHEPDAGRRNLMVEASLRRLENAPVAAPKRGIRSATLMSLEDLAVRVVGDLLVSKQSLNPVKSLRGLGPGVGVKLFKYLVKKEKLDHFSLSKLVACSLPSINLDGYRYATNALLKAVGKHSSITSLSIRSSQYLTDKGINDLTMLRNLKKLNLGMCLLTDHSVPALVQFVNLESLNLQGTKISDDGVKVLAQNLGKIRELDLGACKKVTGLSLLYLQALRDLVWLNVEDTQIRDLSFVKGLKGLQFLGLANCPLAEQSFHCLNACTNLEHLDLTNTGISDEDFISIRDLTNLKVLKFPGREIFVDQLFSYFEGFPLEELDLGGFVNFTDEGAESLLCFQNTLKSLDVGRTKITDVGLGHIARLKNLTALNLDRTAVTFEGLQKLGELRFLGDLSLAHTRTTNGSLTALVQTNLSVSLKSLNVSNSLVTNEGLVTLSQLKNLSFLNIVGTRITRDKIAIHFSGNDLKIRTDGLHANEEEQERAIQRRQEELLRQQQQQQAMAGFGDEDEDGDHIMED